MILDRRATRTRTVHAPRRERIAARRRKLAGLVLALAIGLVAGLHASQAAAHARSVSYSSFAIDGEGADIVLRMPLLELSRLGPEALESVEIGAARFAQQLVLDANGTTCRPRGKVRRAADAEGWVRYRWRVDCPTDSGPLSVRSGVLLEVAPSHLHFARIRFTADPERVREQVLTEASPLFWLRDDPDSVGSDFDDYLVLGVRHILSGWDHLAFLLGLILLSDRLGTIVRLVSGFTLAHSLTLALSVLDLVHPRAEAVEAVIAFSVALVAVEKGWLVAGRPREIPIGVIAGLAGLALASAFVGSALSIVTVLGLILFTACYFALASDTRDERLRIALTFAFGLVHGFGFAGILLELDLPTERLVPALAGFNLGVELGQIGVVLVVWPALALAARRLRPAWQAFARDLSTASLCGLGCFWLFERAFSL